MPHKHVAGQVIQQLPDEEEEHRSPSEGVGHCDDGEVHCDDGAGNCDQW